MKIPRLSGLVSLLPNPWILIGIAVAIAAASSITGYFSYKYAFNKQQIEIDKIVNERQQERNEWNVKLADTQINGWKSLDTWKSSAQLIYLTRQEIITKWRTEYVADPSCGLSQQAVKVVNSLLEVE